MEYGGRVDYSYARPGFYRQWPNDDEILVLLVDAKEPGPDTVFTQTVFEPLDETLLV